MLGRVLLVEDEALVRLLAAEALRESGYSVVEAATGDEAAVLLLGPARFDLLLTDVRMPGVLDGLNVATKARERQPGIPILVVSGYSTGLARRFEELSPPSAFLQKPYHLDALLDATRQLTSLNTQNLTNH
jgi:CheY-like chemotaxis protein